MIRSIALTLLVLVTLTVGGPSHAQEAKHKAIVKAERYLNNLTTFVADFIQTSPEGKVATGRFFLKRPGKFRWQYDPPTPIVITAGFGLLSYQDLELDQVSHVPVDDTLAGFLARDELRLTGDVEVVTWRDEGGWLQLTLAQPNQPEQGELTLTFQSTPMELRRLDVVDATGKMTTVALQNVKRGQDLPDALFAVNTLDRKGRKN